MLFQILEPGQEQTVSLANQAVVGIDFGTTHSLVAIVKDGKPYALPLEEGQPLVPSVVAKTKEGAWVVGRAALLEPCPIVSIKRQLEGENRGYATEIAQHILTYLKTKAEAYLGQPLGYAIITVPAHFSQNARNAIRLAAHRSGIRVLRLLNEPTAAALAYGVAHGPEGLFLVYDLGGGTFDVSLLRLQDEVFQVVATSGDFQLGGDDMDGLLAVELGCSVLEARRLKESLSFQEEVSWGDGKVFSKRAFEQLVAPLVDRTMDVVRGVLGEANCTPQDVQAVLLVGGATRMPLISRRLEELFLKKPLGSMNPDEVVAEGAALQAHGLCYGSNTLLLDVTSLSLGLETLGGRVEKIISRNMPIPTSVSQLFTTSHQNQTAIRINVFQGEGELVSECQPLGQLVLKNIQPGMPGSAKVEITFALDTEGILTVSAEDQKSGQLQQLEILPPV